MTSSIGGFTWSSFYYFTTLLTGLYNNVFILFIRRNSTVKLQLMNEKDKIQISDFNMLSLIGIGNYAKVVLVRKKSNGKVYAMKIVKKRKETNIENKLIKKNHAYIEK